MSSLEFCGVVFQTSFLLDIFYYSNFFNRFSLETSLVYSLLFSFIIIVLKPIFLFVSVGSGSGDRQAFDPRPSLIWNTRLTAVIIQSISMTTVIIQSISLNNCKTERLKIFAFIVHHVNNLLFHSFSWQQIIKRKFSSQFILDLYMLFVLNKPRRACEQAFHSIRHSDRRRGKIKKKSTR